MSAPYELDDATAEAVLAGRSVQADLEPLVRAMSVYRDAARRSVPPRGELAMLLVSGRFPGRPKRKRGARLVVLSGLTVAAAAAGVTSAAAAGVLPDPVQNRLDSVVGSVNERDTPPDNENAEFGGRVSEDARDGGVDGPEISEEARQQGERHQPTERPGQRGRPTELPTPDDIPADPPDAPPAGPPERLPTPPAGPRS